MIKRSQVGSESRKFRVLKRKAYRSCQSVNCDSTSNPDYVVNIYQDGDYLVLVLPDNRTKYGVRYRRIKAEYSCFISKSNLSDELYRHLNTFPGIKGINIEGEWVRIYWKNRDLCKQYCKAFHDKGIITYEGNINPVLRYIADNDIKIARPRIAYIDIETDSRIPFSRKEEMRILSYAIVDENNKVYWAGLEDDTDECERQLLKKMWNTLYNYDLVTAWNGDRFDFPVMKARSIDRRIYSDSDWQWNRWLWLDHLALFRRMNITAAESGDEKQSYKLGDIAQVLLGERKDNFDASKTWQFWNAGGRGRNKLYKYNIKDTRLLKMIEDKTGYIELLLTLGDACRTFGNTRGTNPTIQVESFFQRLAVSENHKFVSVLKYGKDKGDQYKGAYVMEPTVSGITKNVHVADFSSLYPTVIKTWNMSPDTIIKNSEEVDTDKAAYSPLTDVYFDQTVEGILPKAISELLRLRKHWNNKKSKATPGTSKWKDADRKSTAYKIAANSFYGVIGTPVSRFFDKEVAEAVTQCSVYLIKETIKRAEKIGMDVIYCDTDSVFVSNATKSEFESFVNKCNRVVYPKLLKKLGCKNNFINLAYEKEFERIIFTTAKRYIGRYAHYKGTKATEESKPEVKGLEYKRGDSIKLARQMQEQIVDLLVGGKNGGHEDPKLFENLVNEWFQKIMNDDFGIEDIMISKRLSRNIDQYKRRLKKDGTFARQLPHIEVARILEQRGLDVEEGAKIDYIIVDGSGKNQTVIPAIDFNGEYDRKAIWDTLVFPPSFRLLQATFPMISWKDWKSAKKVLKGK